MVEMQKADIMFLINAMLAMFPEWQRAEVLETIKANLEAGQ